MQTQTIASQLLTCCEPIMHAARWQALHDVTLAAVSGRPLTLTGLALGTARTTNMRHRVKCVDRLLCNPHLKDERVAAYGALAHEWLEGLPQLLVAVDWSGLTADMQWHWLRASVVVEGRSLTLYEEVHPRKHLTSKRVHRQFIKRIKALLPQTLRPPIIITDAGCSKHLVSSDCRAGLVLDRAHPQPRLRAPAGRRVVPRQAALRTGDRSGTRFGGVRGGAE